MNIEIAEELGTEGGVPADQTSDNPETTEKSASTEDAEQSEAGSDIIELDGTDKFKFRGKEWTPEELDKAMLRHADYTRKSQEIAETRKQFESEAQYIDSIPYDLEKVRANPGLSAEFKRIYPPKYHKYLDFAVGGDSTQSQSEENTYSELPPHVAKRLEKLDELEAKVQKIDKFEETFKERERESAISQIDSIFDKYTQKYPDAVEDSVLNAAERMLAENQDNPNFQMTEAAWEKLFKQSDKYFKQRWEKRQRSHVDSQLEASKRASDTAPGGAAPGRAPQKQSIAEATDQMLADLKAEGLR